MTIQRAIKKYGRAWLSAYRVVAIGSGEKVRDGKPTGKDAIVFSVEKKVALHDIPSRYRIPIEIKGMPTDVIETGAFKIIPPAPVAKVNRILKHRPAPGGVSIGHTLVSAGSLGCLVRREGVTYILSNNHVLSNSNDAMKGDAIVQPGVHDGGQNPRDRIASLADFVPITFGGGSLPPTECPIGNGAASILNVVARLFGRSTRLYAYGDTDNYVDAAIALPDPKDVSPNILEIGIPNGVRVAELGDTLVKSGRTTGLTTGKVDQVGVTVQVQYGEGKVAVFVDQIIAGEMSAGGDSGSAVLDKDRNVVGLLFAGSDKTTVINRFEHVVRLLKLDGVVTEG